MVGSNVINDYSVYCHIGKAKTCGGYKWEYADVKETA